MKENSKTLLLADSQIDEVTALKLAIEHGLPDLKVITADRGENALQLAEQRPPAAILADLRLSDMSGLKLLMKMKARHPGIVTMMMSDSGSDQAHAMCRDAGIDLFIEKPVSVDQIKGMLGSGSTSSGTVFRGTLDQLAVPDVLQLVADREPPMLMRLDSEKGQGAIEINRGEVVHARVNGRVGEQAFFELVSWHTGHFEVVDVLWPEERTIALPLQQILMRAAAHQQEQRQQGEAEEQERLLKAKEPSKFFDAQGRSGTGSVWDYMSHYKRPSTGGFAPNIQSRSAAMASMPAFAAYYRERGGGQPLRFKARETRPPRPPEPSTVEVSPPAPSQPGRRRPIKLPSARRLVAAGALALAALLGIVQYTGLFSVQYGRDLAPAVMDLIQDIVPGAEQGASRQAQRALRTPRSSGVVISNDRLAPANSSALTAASHATGPDSAMPWSRFSVGVRDDERLLVGVNHVGVRADEFERLHLAENPWVELRCPKGRHMGGYAVSLEDSPEAVVLTRSMAQGFGYGVEDLSEVVVRPVEWDRKTSQSVQFERNRELPGRFCSYWYSVGMSLAAMQEAGLTPGAHAVIRGPAGL